LDCRFLLRLSFFAGTALARIDVMIHNPKRARHRHGLWDLGDPGSMLFRELSLRLSVAGVGQPTVTWQAEPDQAPLTTRGGFLEIYQDSSGGAHWDSNNHVNRNGQVPCSFRGYRVRADGQERVGLRASPLITVRGVNGAVTVALPEFWQQFPKAIAVEDRLLRVDLFPRQFADLHELQG